MCAVAGKVYIQPQRKDSDQGKDRPKAHEDSIACPLQIDRTFLTAVAATSPLIRCLTLSVEASRH